MKNTTNTLTKSRNNFAGVHYTVNHTGKMAGLASLSGDINSNPLCMARQKKGTAVCSHCFAARMFDDAAGRYRGVNNAFKVNSEILSGRVLEWSEIPTIDPARWPLFRFAAYDDVINITQVINYTKIARKNPGVSFALWSKNPGIVARAFDIVGKPQNLQFVLSSLNLNTPAAGAARVPYVDKVFTVYDSADKAPAPGINCGARSCFACRRCYTPAAGLEYVNELIK